MSACTDHAGKQAGKTFIAMFMIYVAIIAQYFRRDMLFQTDDYSFNKHEGAFYKTKIRAYDFRNTCTYISLPI